MIGVRSETPRGDLAQLKRARYPSLAQIAGYMLDTLFMDSLYADLERLTRLNQLIANIPQSRFRTPKHELKCIEALVILPSRDIIEIAARHVKSLPRSVRLLMSGVGGLNARGRPLMSYLLFEAEFCQELMELGYKDAISHRSRILKFLRGDEVDQLSAPDPLRALLADEEKRAETE